MLFGKSLFQSVVDRLDDEAEEQPVAEEQTFRAHELLHRAEDREQDRVAREHEQHEPQGPALAHDEHEIESREIHRVEEPQRRQRAVRPRARRPGGHGRILREKRLHAVGDLVKARVEHAGQHEHVEETQRPQPPQRPVLARLPRGPVLQRRERDQHAEAAPERNERT